MGNTSYDLVEPIDYFGNEVVYNNLVELRNYFGESKPLSMIDFMRFWQGLTWQEKLYFKRAPLT